MSTPSDADVPLVHASFTCVETTAEKIAKDVRTQALRSPKSWIFLGTSFVLLALAFWLDIRVAEYDMTSYWLALPLVLFFALLFTSLLKGLIKNSQAKRMFAVEYPAGAILRSEFGTQRFTLRIPRGSLSYSYGELLPVVAGKHTVAIRLRHQPQLALVRPRELFPDAALDLIEPHAQIRGRS